MASITLPLGRKREHTSKETAVPVKFTRSGTPYVDSAVAVMPPQALQRLIQQHRTAKQESSES